MIDSHIHLFEHGYGGGQLADEELRVYTAYAENFGIEAALVVGFEGADLYRNNNAYLARIAVAHSWIRPVAYVSAETGRRAFASAADLRLDRFVGISLYVLTDQALAGIQSWTRTEWDQVPEPGIVSINTTPRLLHSLGEIAAEHLELTFIISHFGSPLRPGKRGVSGALQNLLDLSAANNVHVKASGYYALSKDGWTTAEQASATAMAVESFGQRRVHWGSDFSPCLEATTFASALAPPGVDALARDGLAGLLLPS